MRYNRFAGVQKRISTLTIATVFFASSVAAATVPLLVNQFARAATDTVVINEIRPATGGGTTKWVELYNTSADPIDIAGWRLTRGGAGNTWGNVFPSDTTIAANGYHVVESTDSLPLSSATSLVLRTGPPSNGENIDSASYPNLTDGETYGRSPDGSDNWIVFSATQVTKGSENYVESALNPEITSISPFGTRSDSYYKGISVDFAFNEVEDATDVTVAIKRQDDTTITKSAGPGVLKLINNDGATGLTTPFVIQEGDFSEATDKDPDDDLYWNPATGDTDWSDSTRPVKVTVTIESENGPATLSSENFLDSGIYPTYESLLPDTAAPAQVEGLQIRKGHSATAPLLGCGGYTNSTQIRIEWDHSPESDIDYYWFGTKFNAKHAKVAADKYFYHGNMTPGNNPYYYTVIAVDIAGNESEISEQCGIILDTAAPLAKIIGPGDGDFVSGIVALVGEVTDDNPMNSYFRVEGPNSYVKTSLHTDGRFLHEFNWNTSGLDDGEYKIFFEARDKADNKDGSRSNPGDSVDVITVLIDRTSPVVDIENVQVSQDKKLSFDLSATDTGPAGLLHVAANIYNESNTGSPLITLGSGNPTRLNDPHSGLPLGTPLFNASPSNIDVSELPTGTYTIRAFARDHAGNEHRFKLAYFVVDNTAPSVNAGDDDLVAGLAYGLNGIVSDNESGIASFVWSLLSSPAGETANFDDETALDTAVNVTGYGAYVFELTAIDNAGNVSADTVEITFEEPVETSGGGAVESVTTNTPNNISRFAANFFGNVFNNTANPGQDNQQNENIDENEAAETSGQVESESITQDTDEQGAAEAENTNTITWYWILFVLLLALAAYYGYRNIRHSKDD